MRDNLGRIRTLAERQHDLIATWQLRKLHLTRGQIGATVRRLRRVHQGVYAFDDLTEHGWLMAAALALGPAAVISHRSALMLLELRPYEPGDIDVCVPGRHGRERREGIIIHRPRCDMETGTCHGIPVTSPTQSLRDTDLPPHELYRALEEVDRQALRVDRSRLPRDVVALQRAVRGRTRSDAEARFLLLCRDHGIELPLVNHRVNGIEADFHRPGRLVVEVDGFEFHKERRQFEEDRRRGLVHNSARVPVARVSALQVRDEPALVAAAVAALL